MATYIEVLQSLRQDGFHGVTMAIVREAKDVGNEISCDFCGRKFASDQKVLVAGTPGTQYVLCVDRNACKKKVAETKDSFVKDVIL
jgi:hypothetical protein